MTTLDDLLGYICDGKKPALYPEFEGWVRGSRRFKAFATNYRGKIRAKLRNLRDESGMKDLRAELETAALLLREERFTLEYEKYAASKQRGPDFTVTFKTHTRFNVEVRRVRSVELDDGDTEARTGKLMAVLCDKVGQMPTSIVNLLWLIAEREISEADLIRAALTLRELAERKAEDFFTRRDFGSAADFLKQYRQLSGIVLRQSGENVLWLNSLARHKTPPEIVTALQRLGPI
ncbi:MAG TPA: hypothetical protein VMT24_18120 [Aggregatilineaceae bacterium]|jgi:hypothetical protein|nr:hypothetical protein [Aggregatilineaceae bacterium]